MDAIEKIKISVQVTINDTIDNVWKCFTTPEDIINWNTASDDWHTTEATNNLQIGGKFSYRMEAKDGSFGFDFWGIYDEVIHHEKLACTLGDSREMEIKFLPQGNSTKIEEIFDAENENPIEMQREGWQAILDNLKKYIEIK
jgi:uncharacterized protein YndB with AHSA1/START domain